MTMPISLHFPDTLILLVMMASSTPGFPCLFLCFFFYFSFSSLHLYGTHPGFSPWSFPWNFLLLLGEFITPQDLHTSSLTILSLKSPAPYLKLCTDTSHSLSSFLVQSYHSLPPIAKPTTRERMDINH